MVNKNDVEVQLKKILSEILNNECDDLFSDTAGTEKKACSDFLLSDFQTEMGLNDPFIEELNTEELTLDFINRTDYYVEFENFLTREFTENVSTEFKNEAVKLNPDFTNLTPEEILHVTKLKPFFDEQLEKKIKQYI